jgi:PadR family transcriptional regulator, regulatory protein PadR
MPDVLRGTLDLMILQSLALAPMHGTAIAERLAQVTGGAVEVGPGSLFPALYRLEHKGWLRGSWGQTERGHRARLYKLTAAGRRRLGVERKNWSSVALAMKRILEGSGI